MIKSIVLDISKHMQTATQTIVLRQGDKNSLTLNIAINEDDMAFDLNDYEARFMAQLQNGKVIIDPCEKMGANVVNYTLPSALTANAGTISLSYISIYQGEEWIASTEAVAFYVLPGVDVSSAEAESFISEFVALKSKLEGLLAEAEDQKAQQQASWQEQTSAQQFSWQSQLESQEVQFQEQEAARAEAEKRREKAFDDLVGALQELSCITAEEIDALWRS